MSKNMCRVCFVDLKHECELVLMTVENKTYSEVFLDHLISDHELLQIPEGYEQRSRRQFYCQVQYLII